MRLCTHPATLRRDGASAVEFALVAPILFTLVFASIDCARAMMGMDLLANAARTGGRVASITNKSNSDVTTAVNNQVTNSGFASAQTTIAVNGSTGTDVQTAKTGDQITVTVSMTYDSISWLPAKWYFGGSTLTRSFVIRKE